jgi:hypothetical protein
MLWLHTKTPYLRIKRLLFLLTYTVLVCAAQKMGKTAETLSVLKQNALKQRLIRAHAPPSSIYNKLPTLPSRNIFRSIPIVNTLGNLISNNEQRAYTELV